MTIYFDIETNTVEKLKDLYKTTEKVGKFHFGKVGTNWALSVKNMKLKVVVDDYIFLIDLMASKEDPNMKDFTSDIINNFPYPIKIVNF